MTNEMRSSVVNYCNIGVGNENANRLQLDWPLHPRLRKSYTYLKDKFREVILGDHDLLTIETHREKMLGFMPGQAQHDLRGKMKQAWANKMNNLDDSKTTSQQLFDMFEKNYNMWKREGKIREQDLSIEALVLTYLYPRIDSNVSTGINHLLKSPWCIHPKTGK